MIINKMATIPSSGDNANKVNVKVATIPRGRVLGDVDKDGRVTSADSFFVSQYTTGGYSLDDEAQLAADVDGNSLITSTDSLRIRQIYKGTYSANTDVTNTWTSNPNYSSETAKFYYDLAVEGITSGSDATILIEYNGIEDIFVNAECGSGYIRFWVVAPPVADCPCTVIWQKDGMGQTSIIETSSKIALNQRPIEYHVTLSSGNWGEDDGEFIQTVDIPFVRSYSSTLANNMIVVQPSTISNAETFEGCGVKWSRSDSKITFYANTMPTKNIVLIVTLLETRYMGAITGYNPG